MTDLNDQNQNDSSDSQRKGRKCSIIMSTPLTPIYYPIPFLLSENSAYSRSDQQYKIKQNGSHYCLGNNQPLLRKSALVSRGARCRVYWRAQILPSLLALWVLTPSILAPKSLGDITDWCTPKLKYSIRSFQEPFPPPCWMHQAINTSCIEMCFFGG